MEVHHHPKVEKKNFREYFLEFIMIFLAVTMGFIAENIREDIAHSRQVNEYVHSLVSDLKSDVNMYHDYDSVNLAYCSMIDTIFAALNNKNTGVAYYLARRLTMIGSFVPSINAKTYLQMTSTGAFRLLKHHAVADSIAGYYQLIKSFDYWSDLQRTRVNNIIDVSSKLFSADVFFSLYKTMEHNSDSLRHIILSNPSLISNDERDINEVKMYYQYFYGFMKVMNTRSTVASAQAKKLIMLLEKEYDLKNE